MECVLGGCSLVLAPFFEDHDLLELSASSKWLLDVYRRQKHELLLKPRTCHEVKASQSDALLSLLQKQQCLHHLSVGDSNAISGLAQIVAGRGVFANNLTSLTLEEAGTGPGLQLLSNAIASGCLPHLKCLEAKDSSAPNKRLPPLLKALEYGTACPHLTCLHLGSRVGGRTLKYLGEVLEKRAVLGRAGLRDLSLSIGQGLSPEDCIGAVARVVAVTCRTLEVLRLEGHGPLTRGVQAGLLLRGDNDRLNAAAVYDKGGSGKAAAEAAPMLRHLRLGLILYEAREEEGMPIAEALASGAAPRLEVLELRSVPIRRHAWTTLIEAIGQGKLPLLKELQASTAGLSTEDISRLASLMSADPKPWGRLTRLDLSGNRLLRCAGLAHLANGLSQGGLSNLKELLLERTCKGDSGPTAIFEALSNGPAGANLKRLDLTGCGLGPQGIKALAKALKGGGRGGGSTTTVSNRSSRSRSLLHRNNSYNKISLVGHAEEEEGGYCGGKNDVNRRKAFSQLEWLALPKNALGDKGVACLASALADVGRAQGEGEEGKAVAAPSLVRLDLWAVGMGKEGAFALAEALSSGACPQLERLDAQQWPKLEVQARDALQGALQDAHRRGRRRKTMSLQL